MCTPLGGRFNFLFEIAVVALCKRSSRAELWSLFSVLVAQSVFCNLLENKYLADIHAWRGRHESEIRF